MSKSTAKKQPKKPVADNRMAWIRNLDALSKQAKRIAPYPVECEFETECHIPGLLSYAEDRILCGALSFEKSQEGLRRYLLRIEYPEGPAAYNFDAQEKGYYFKGGIAEEMLSLFSLFFQSRFYLRATYSGALTKQGLKMRMEHRHRYEPVPTEIHPKVLGDRKDRNFATGLADFLDDVRKLDSKLHGRFMLACWHYARALREIGVDSEMLFIRLVSAIEILSEDLNLPQDQNPLNGVAFDSVVRKGDMSAAQLKQLREILGVTKDGQIQIQKSKKKFVSFVNKYSTGCLTGGNWKAGHLRIKRKDVPKYVGRIYDARSAYLHSGEPMYLSQFMRSPGHWDIDPSLGMIVDNKKFSDKKKLPYTYWFENLVRCCLLNYLKDQTA